MGKTTVVVYVLCYDDATEAAARAEHAGRAWARVLRVPEPVVGDVEGKYLETAAYLSLLDSRRAEWEHADFVGTLSWKASTKIGCVDRIPRLCHAFRRRDVIALLSLPRENLLDQAEAGHPGFSRVWVPLLEGLGYSADDAVDPAVRPFMCNYWLARPAWMDRYSAFCRRAVRLLEAEGPLREAAWRDARYAENQFGEAWCLRTYGRPYLPFHPFVCERLPCFFFWKEGASVAALDMRCTL